MASIWQFVAQYSQVQLALHSKGPGWRALAKSLALSLVYLGCAFGSLVASPCRSSKIPLASRGAILMDVETGDILYEKQGDQRFYPASTTKIATALFALERGADSALFAQVCADKRWLGSISCEKKVARRYRVPPFWIEAKSTHVGIKAGEVLTVRDLLYGALLASGNDAANLLAAHTSGAVEPFMLELGGYLRRIGCAQTQLLNPHGLYHPNHFTTPKDLALIARRAMAFPIFREIVSATFYLRPPTNLQRATLWRQTNRLIRRGPFYYSKAIGIKPGYTRLAKHALVAAAKHKTRTLLAVLMGGPSAGAIYTDAIALFETVFQEPEIERVLLQPGEVTWHLSMGSNTSWSVGLQNPFVVQGSASDFEKARIQIKWRKRAGESDVEPGEQIADLRLLSPGGRSLASIPLLALHRRPGLSRNWLWQVRWELILLPVFFVAALVMLSWQHRDEKAG